MRDTVGARKHALSARCSNYPTSDGSEAADRLITQLNVTAQLILDSTVSRARNVLSGSAQIRRLLAQSSGTQQASTSGKRRLGHSPRRRFLQKGS